MKSVHTTLVAAAGALSVAMAGPAMAIEFNEIARFNVSFAFASDLDPEDGIFDDNPKYIGTNPLGLAWNGSKLYLGGHDNFGSSLLPIGLIEVLNPTRTGVVSLVDADFSDAFGQIFQPIGRGYTNLELQGDRLAAAYDNGNNTANAYQLFDTNNNSLVWDLSAAGITARGGAGVNFDPGFNGSGASQGVAFTAFGSGRRGLLDTATGAVIHSLDGAQPNAGFIWIPNPAPGGNIARDFAFDPATGDMYIRRNNDVDATSRTGANTSNNQRTLFDDASDAGAFKLGQKIEFIGGTSEGDVLIFNDSAVSSSDQTFSNVVKVIDTNGVAKTPTFNLIGGGTADDIAAGAGIYDFDYDPTTNTLAVLDFFNRNVFIFEVGGGAGLEGDYNGDNVVDAADYTVWRDTLGSTSDLRADGNGNGIIDGPGANSDYVVWTTNYGAASPGVVAVPEPATLLLGALAGVALLRRR
jgi:hypothetical protein